MLRRPQSGRLEAWPQTPILPRGVATASVWPCFETRPSGAPQHEGLNSRDLKSFINAPPAHPADVAQGRARLLRLAARAKVSRTAHRRRRSLLEGAALYEHGRHPHHLRPDDE